MKPRVAFIGTGGTIASVGRGPLDLADDTATGRLLDAAGLLARFPEVREVAEVPRWPASSSATGRRRSRRRRISPRSR